MQTRQPPHPATTGIQVFSQVNKYTLSYRFLYGNVQGCVFAKHRPVSLNWTDYSLRVSYEAQILRSAVTE